MNDEKYMYFTERIQNTLVKPEILTLMNSKTGAGKTENEAQMEEKKKEEAKLSKEELFRKKQEDHEKRKKERTEKLAIN